MKIGNLLKKAKAISGRIKVDMYALMEDEVYRNNMRSDNWEVTFAALQSNAATLASSMAPEYDIPWQEYQKFVDLVQSDLATFLAVLIEEFYA